MKLTITTQEVKRNNEIYWVATCKEFSLSVAAKDKEGSVLSLGYVLGEIFFANSLLLRHDHNNVKLIANIEINELQSDYQICRSYV